MTGVDYHMHLVPDDHVGPCPYTLDRVAQYVRAAEARGVGEIGITDHCHRFVQFQELFRPIYEGPRQRDPEVAWLQLNFTEHLDRYVETLVQAQQRGWPVKIGLEVDWFSYPGAEAAPEAIREILAPYPWDYILGSVHFLADWPIDVSAAYEWPTGEVDAVYDQYFTQLAAAASSGLYDVMAHPDLVKKFGHIPTPPLASRYEAAVKAFHRADVALEVSTAGLRYPIGELYPAPGFLAMAAEQGVPITIGSDAHDPALVGSEGARAVQAARAAGYTEVALFSRGQRVAVPLPDLSLGRPTADPPS